MPQIFKLRKGAKQKKQKNKKKKYLFYSLFFLVKIKHANVFGKGAHHWGTFNCPWQCVFSKKAGVQDWSWPLKFFWIPVGKKWECVNHSWRNAWIIWLVHVLRFCTENSRQPSFGLNLWLYYLKMMLFAANGSTKERWYISGQVIWASNISNPITPFLHSYLTLIHQGLEATLLLSAALTPQHPSKKQKKNQNWDYCHWRWKLNHQSFRES